ncbi:MAG: hypothetical protein JW751_20970 [Polyangiaceae bacterium]|nr:hypothetical protein [Polyangiaceae bacterium]
MPFVALLAGLAACGGQDDEPTTTSQALVWRCTQTPALALDNASCACTGYSPGEQGSFIGAEVAVCDAVLVCCFIGPAQADNLGVVEGEQECRCTKANVGGLNCEQQIASRPGFTAVQGGMCPPVSG